MKTTRSTSIRLHGDERIASSFIPIVKKELTILENSMSFQDSPIGKRAVFLPNGGLGRVKIVNTIATIDIFVPHTKSKLEPELKPLLIPELEQPNASGKPYVTIYGSREWTLDKLGGNYIVVISTQSQQEAFAWDIFTDKLFIKKTSLEAVETALQEINVPIIQEAIPSGHFDELWIRQAPTIHEYTGEPNQPMFFYSKLSPDGDGLSEDAFHWPSDHYFSESLEHIAWQYHYLDPPIELATYGLRAPIVIYVFKQTVPPLPNESYAYLFLNTVFGYNITGIPAYRQNLDVVSELIHEEHNIEEAEVVRNCWLSFGIATKEASSIIFEYVGLCLVTDEVYRNECVDMLDNYENRIFRIYAYTEPNFSLFEAELFDLINAERTSTGLLPLHHNKNLHTAAKRHVDDMAKQGILSHAGSDGSDFQSRILDANFMLYHNEDTQPHGYGENIALADPLVNTPAEVVSAWMGSPGHAAVILTTEFTCTGLATTVKNGYLYICQTFGYRDQTWPGYAAFDTTKIIEYIIENFEYSGGLEDATGVLKVYHAGAIDQKNLLLKINKGPYEKPHEFYHDPEQLRLPGQKPPKHANEFLNRLREQEKK